MKKLLVSLLVLSSLSELKAQKYGGSDICSGPQVIVARATGTTPVWISTNTGGFLCDVQIGTSPTDIVDYAACLDSAPVTIAGIGSVTGPDGTGFGPHAFDDPRQLFVNLASSNTAARGLRDIGFSGVSFTNLACMRSNIRTAVRVFYVPGVR